jgi:hypothetical protein
VGQEVGVDRPVGAALRVSRIAVDQHQVD